MKAANLAVVIFWSLVVVCLGRGQWVPKRYIKNANPTIDENFGLEINYPSDGRQFSTRFNGSNGGYYPEEVKLYLWEGSEYISNCNQTTFSNVNAIFMIQTPAGYYWSAVYYAEMQRYQSINCEFNPFYQESDFDLRYVLPKFNQSSLFTFSLLMVYSNYIEILMCDNRNTTCSSVRTISNFTLGISSRGWWDKTGRWLLAERTVQPITQTTLYDMQIFDQKFLENLTIDDIKTNLTFDSADVSAVAFGRRFFAISRFNDNDTVEIYSLDGLNVVETLYGDGKNTTSNFGSSLAISDNFLVVGAPYSGESGSVDKVFIYKIETNGSAINPSPFQVLQPSVEGLDCGISVAINAGVILVGCPSDSTDFADTTPINNESHLRQVLGNNSNMEGSGSIILYSLECDEGITINRGLICSPNSSNVVLTFESENVTIDFPLTIRNSILEIPRNVRNIYTPGFLLSETSTISLTLGTQITTDSCAELNGTLELFLPNVTKSSINGTRVQIVNFNCTKPPTGLNSLVIKQIEETGSAEACGGLVGTPEYSNINMGVLFSVDYSECGGESSDSNDALLIGLVVGLVGGCILLVIIGLLVFFAITYFTKKKEANSRTGRKSEMIQF
eukprot:TRINITY_DN539_c1_g1_i1.p1 TRINITY_DN539_c1_g1~~TRINITY_DN539_c1_g1_i1.p1  ORF type:complete len:617 (-),score=77.79 TRINITY_DN539_c1_g1_i1:237-2087(-)